MKKIISLLLVILITLLPLAACERAVEEEFDAERVVVRLAGMKGPTSIGMVGLLDDNEKGSTKNDYKFSLHGAASEIVPMLIKGELDIAAVPANLAATLYNSTQGEVQLLAVNNLGVVYIVAKNEDIKSVADLKGKTIFATGKGSTPEIALRHILSANGIDHDSDVTVEYRDEASAILPELQKNESAIAMLPQPYVTVACSKVEGLKTVLDLNKEWESVNPDCGLVTGVIVVRKSFATENPQAVKDFMTEYENSVKTVLNDNKNASELVVKHGIFDNQAVIEKAIPKCNLTFISGEDMKNPVNKYLGVSYEQNPKSIGGSIPDDDFYYVP